MQAGSRNKPEQQWLAANNCRRTMNNSANEKTK
jgi:hypothetical protein